MTSPKPKLLVVDDRPDLIRSLTKILAGDVELVGAGDGATAIELLGRERIAMVVCDREGESVDVLAACKRLQPSAVFVLLSDQAETAARAIRLGAYDSLTKPFEPEELRTVVLRALGRARSLGDEPAGSGPENGELLPGVVGRSPAMHELAELVRKVATTSTTALILGEAGSGKPRIARALHTLGDRAHRRFVALDCAAITQEQLDAELDQAGGTLFLDEIADLRASLQTRLIQWIDQRSADVRLIAATHHDLDAMVREGTFRADLHQRLAAAVLQVPPLRERSEDIPLLARRFLADLADKRPECAREFSSSAITLLRAASWPGNLRQLRAVVEHAALSAHGHCIDVEDLPPDLRVGHPLEASGRTDAGMTWQAAIDHARDRMAPGYLRTLLAAERGNVVAAANRAGIERESFYRLLRKYGVRADEFRGRGHA
jgi:two-component system response regulator HydG